VTERLYYTDSFLRSFEARVVRIEDRRLVLDRTAFYPASGGQPHDTGVIEGLRVVDVLENEAGEVVHVLERAPALEPGQAVKGEIDWERRADHIQQHTGQHLLSAVFVHLFGFPTVSFHLGSDTSTIDIETVSLTPAQARQAEELSNAIIFEDRPLRVFFATAEEARNLPLRKDAEREGQLRLVEIPGIDLSACGGTHAARTGQIGGLMLRKIEKSRLGVRVEFVCGQRGVRLAKADYGVLAETAGVFTTHPHQLAGVVRKQLEELKAAERERQKLLLELAGYQARQLYAAAFETNGVRQLVKVFGDADPAYVRQLASQFAAQPAARALFAVKKQPTLVLAQSRGLQADLGGLIKKLAAEFGLRGGGSRDSAQAGAPDADKLQAALEALVREIEPRS
jgi:alanyl-tRNA synthetase